MSKDLQANKASFHDHGKNDFKDLFLYICSMPYIIDLFSSEQPLDFNPILAETVSSRFKSLVFDIIYNF